MDASGRKRTHMDTKTRITKLERIIANHLALADQSKTNELFRAHVAEATRLGVRVRELKFGAGK